MCNRDISIWHFHWPRRSNAIFHNISITGHWSQFVYDIIVNPLRQKTEISYSVLLSIVLNNFECFVVFTFLIYINWWQIVELFYRIVAIRSDDQILILFKWLHDFLIILPLRFWHIDDSECSSKYANASEYKHASMESNELDQSWQKFNVKKYAQPHRCHTEWHSGFLNFFGKNFWHYGGWKSKEGPLGRNIRKLVQAELTSGIQSKSSSCGMLHDLNII